MTLPDTMGAGVPLYAHPGINPAAWATLAVRGAPVHWVVLNQASGPGETEDEVLYDAAREVRDSGVQVLGYIDLDYGNRDDFFTNADADLYVARGITGAFLDRAPNDQAHISTTAQTVLRLRDHGIDHIVLNPGTTTLQPYADFVDQIVTFEGDLDAYRTATAPDWVSGYPPERFAHLLHGVTTPADAKEAVRLARHRGCHTLFAHSTPYTPESNAWDGLPSYWSTLARELGRYPSRPAPGGWDD